VVLEQYIKNRKQIYLSLIGFKKMVVIVNKDKIVILFDKIGILSMNSAHYKG
jgi:hypothetical protein